MKKFLATCAAIMFKLSQRQTRQQDATSRCKKFLATCAAILLSANTTFAAEGMSLTLDEAIGLALKNNRLIEQSTEDRESARWNLSAMRRTSGLTLSWTSTYYHIGGRYYRRSYRDNRDEVSWRSKYDDRYNLNLFPKYDYENTNSFRLRMNLYTGGQLENRQESARYGLNAADLILENSRQTVKYRAAEAYYQVLRQSSLVDVQKQALELLQEHLRNVTIQYEVGTVAKSDLLATSVQLANTQQSLTTAQGNYQTAVAQLNNVLGLPVETEVAASDKIDFVKYDLTEEQCLDYAVAHRPDGIAAKYSVKRAEADKNAAKAGYRPNISAVMGGDFSGEKFLSGDHRTDRWSVGLEMTWNIFDNGLTAAQVQQYKAAERRAESQALQQLETIQLEVHSAYIALKTAEKNIATTAAAVAKAEEEFAIAQVRYVEGVDTNLNVMNAQEKVVETRNNYYSAVYTYNTSRAQLEKAMGVPVKIDALLYAEAEKSGKSSPKSLEAAAVTGDFDFDAEALKFPFESK